MDLGAIALLAAIVASNVAWREAAARRLLPPACSWGRPAALADARTAFAAAYRVVASGEY